MECYILLTTYLTIVLDQGRVKERTVLRTILTCKKIFLRRILQDLGCNNHFWALPVKFSNKEYWCAERHPPSLVTPSKRKNTAYLLFNLEYESDFPYTSFYVWSPRDSQRKLCNSSSYCCSLILIALIEF